MVPGLLRTFVFVVHASMRVVRHRRLGVCMIKYSQGRTVRSKYRSLTLRVALWLRASKQMEGLTPKGYPGNIVL